jgi:hypothetical protein
MSWETGPLDSADPRKLYSLRTRTIIWNPEENPIKVFKRTGSRSIFSALGWGLPHRLKPGIFSPAAIYRIAR